MVGLFLSCKLPNKILTRQSLVFLPFSLNPFCLFSGLLRLLTRALLRISETDKDSLKPFCFPAYYIDSLCNPHHLQTHPLFCSSSSPAGVDASLCLTTPLSRMCVGRSARWNSTGQTRICSVSFCFRITRGREWSSCFGQRHSKSSSLPLVISHYHGQNLLVAW